LVSTGDRLALDGGAPVSPEPLRPLWPVITPDTLQRLVEQANTAVSIYNRSGVVDEFESAFARYIGRGRALATSSGTAALHSMYYGAEITTADEVICSDYGFFITATPLTLLGARPVFVDSEADGTIAADRVREAITHRTKAVVATHMWGKPARMDELRSLCKVRGLLLFEDCSHAHGSRFRGAVVGSFGTAAAWSMQGKKTVWAGEGGVLVTTDDDIYERALLLGHFNARALQDIPTSSPHRDLAFTGVGLKYRAHPLALAMALPQLTDLDRLIGGRQLGAQILIDALLSVPGLSILSCSDSVSTHSYYALVALVDPIQAGFDRTQFVAALEAENVFFADIPGQMGSMSGLPIFRRAGERSAIGPLHNSVRITEQAVKFFVPAIEVDPRASKDTATVAVAIRKVGGMLPKRSGA
jgi:perosamine synthetase